MQPERLLTHAVYPKGAAKAILEIFMLLIKNWYENETDTRRNKL